MQSSPKLKAVDAAFGAAKERGLIHLTAEDNALDGRTVTLLGGPRVNFGSCSYLGLETDSRLVEGACDAARRFGVQFSSSRAYVSSPLQEELETTLQRIFRAPIVVAQTTSLGHLAALPVLIGQGDAVLVDQFVHNSVQTVIPTLESAGAHCALLRHGRTDLLEAKIIELKKRHRRIWYLADGIYSMNGAIAPIAEVREMLARHEELHVYFDDAHGMSWTGAHGRGTVLGDTDIHPRMVVALSLAKAFSAGGAVLVFPNPEWARLVRTCGSTMIFSGPLQPPLLGAAIASARIHLSEEIGERQERILERIELFNALCEERAIPLRSSAPTPIRFVTIGKESAALEVAARLMESGYYTNVATFPAVPAGQAGIRITLTTHQTLEDIEGLISRLALFRDRGLFMRRAAAAQPRPALVR
jgi:7-keto-8-aminopelargonate synthetase-like enzyme